MALTITPLQGPPHSKIETQQSPASDARAKAIAAFAAAQSGQPAVPNQSNISIEELAAAKEMKQDDSVETAAPDTTSTEPAVDTEATAPKEEESPLSSQYAVLARKEKALRDKVAAREAQFRQREEALTKREAELSNTKSSFDSSKYIAIDELKNNAYGKLLDLGVSYDDISQQALRAQSPEAQEIQRMREEFKGELQKVREEQANTRKSYETQQAQAYQQAVNQIRIEASQLVNSDPSFETIKETGSIGDVVELIERTFKEDGTLLTVEQAAQAVEDELLEEALKISRIKKIQDRLKTKEAPQAEQPKQQAALQNAKQPQPQQLKTLTNSVGSTRPLTAKERALLAFKGELK